MRQQLPVDVTEQPLSLGELMDMIEGARTSDSAYPGGIFSSSWAMMLETTNETEEIVGFLSVSSAFYPKIDGCYMDLAEQWLQENMEPEE